MRKALLYIIISLQALVAIAQPERSDTLAQYLFPSFTRGIVKARNGTTYSLVMNYNVVTGKMVFLQKGICLDLANPEAVDTVLLEGARFIAGEGCFLEVIFTGKISFFARHGGKIAAPEVETGYGTKSESTIAHLYQGLDVPGGVYNIRLPDGYKVRNETSYLLQKGSDRVMFMNENQLVKALPGHEKEIKDFIKLKRLKISRRADLVQIADFCNSLDSK